MLSHDFFPKTLAERCNLWRMTAIGYEPFWRRFSSSLLSGNNWSLENECDHMLNLLQAEEGEYIMDAGCSTGLYARSILDIQPDAFIILTDYSHAMLSKAMDYMPENKNAAYLQCDAANTPIVSGKLDGVVMGGTLNELTNPETVFSEIARLLKSDGRAVVMYLAGKEQSNSVFHRLLSGAGVWIPGRNYVHQLFDKTGFLVKEERGAGLMRIARLQLK